MATLRLSILAGAAAFGAIGATLALMGAGVPFFAAAGAAALAAGLVQWLAQRATRATTPTALRDHSAEDALRQQLEQLRAHTATLRHDLRGVLSPALMMSDRLLGHADPTVQRAGNAVVRSIERATTLLASNKDVLLTAPEIDRTPDAPAEPPAR